MIIRPDGTQDSCQQPTLGSAIPLDVGPGDPVADQHALEHIHALTTGRDVPVAVIDTGASVPGVTGDDNHCYLHGTAVASVVKALAPGAAVTSIRHAPQTTSAQGTVADLIGAINAAVAGGARIINISMVACSGTPELSAALQRAMEGGALVVASTGNTGQCEPGTVPYPAGVEGVLAVGAVEDPFATDSADAGRIPAPYSAPTSVVDVFAPGGPVSAQLAVGGAGGKVHTIVGDPAPFVGTSFAAPFVSATAALVWERDPGATAEQVRSILVDSAALGGAVGDMAEPLRVVDPLAAVTAAMDQAGGTRVGQVSEQPIPSAVVAGQPWHPEPVNVTVPVVLAVVVVVVAIAALIVRARYRR
ncbi:S8 family serine peptidase [Corynebacterium falsenii]|uniref:S8 family serine peptidase n=1 Tax=Corynebacterium falsenii TaxID=108486 RepID=UPI00234D86F2|nr:S8 family serine peptidase [Corynebacterium falsenii]MDC7103114.1 S8 family serine peptidase [Corynebacterium falsenii]